MTTERRLKVYIWPDFGQDPDPGDGGVRRVVEAQRRYLPEHGIDVVETVDEADVLAAHMVATPAIYRSQKPLVSHNHGFYWDEYRWGAGNWAEKDNGELMRSIRRAQAITAPSEWVAAIMRRHTSRPVTPIIHGVDQLPLPAANEGYVLWNKTRVDPICDPRPLVELARRLPEVAFRATVLDEDEPGFSNITITGKLPYLEAVREVAAAGLYLATTRETFGIGTLEAMAAGVPIVGFSWGGQNEIVTHGVDGYLARPGDYDDLAAGVRWALENREALGAWARHNVAEKFTWAKPMAQYADLYRQVFDAAQLDYGRDPRVSVVIPAYRMAKYLPDAVRSVQMQTEPVEIIIVDDASDDETLEVARSLVDERTAVISLPENVGLSGARNAGIQAANGRYILPLDADDMLDPNACQVLADALDRDRNIDVAYGAVLFVDEDGKTPTKYPGREDGRSGWPVEYDLADMFRRPGQPLPYASMYRREAWEYTGGYRRRVKSSEDCDFWCRLGSYGFTPAKVTDATTLIYRNRADSMSRTVGWADVENKAWYPWAHDVTQAPAAGQPGPLVKVPAYDPPLVSVIIPVGPGHEQLVVDAIDSVEAQTFRNWECIVVNDTGKPLPLLPAWVRVVGAGGRPADQPAYLLFMTSASAGVAAARNAGIKAARGALFLPLDADDYLMPDCLERMVAWQRHGGPKTIVYSDFWQTPEDGGEAMTVGPSRDFEAGRPLLQGAIHSVTALTPIAAWREVGGFASNVPWEDWDFALKVYAEAGYCGQRLAAPLWVYRKHTGKRRHDRYDRREAGKKDVLARWGDYIERGKAMACSACGGRTIIPFSSAGIDQSRAMRAPDGPRDGMQLVEYIGRFAGNHQMRGTVTKTMYTFARGQARYVDNRDVEGFLSAPDSFALAGSREAEPVLVTSTAPALVAHEHGQPAPAASAPVATMAPPARPPVAMPTMPAPPLPPGAMPTSPPAMPTQAPTPSLPVDRSLGFDPAMGPPVDFSQQIQQVQNDLPNPDDAAAIAARIRASVESPAMPAAQPATVEDDEPVRVPIGDNGDLVDQAPQAAAPKPAATRGRPPKSTAGQSAKPAKRRTSRPGDAKRS